MASMKGERVPASLVDNADDIAIAQLGVVGAVLGAEALVQAHNFHLFRDEIHKYQRQHRVSGLLIKEIELDEVTFRFSEPDECLLVLEGDMEVLQALKQRTVEAFLNYAQSAPTYLAIVRFSKDGEQFDVETTVDYIKYFAERVQWALIEQIGESQVGIRLGWGNPHEAESLSNKYEEYFYFTAERWCQWVPVVKAKRVTFTLDQIKEMRNAGRL